MKKNFEVGDLVNYVYDEHQKECYMVTDVEVYEDEVDIEIARIYPVRRTTMFVVEEQSELMLFEQHGSRGHGLFMGIVERERQQQGWYEKPDYITARDAKLNLDEDAKIEERELQKYGKKPVKFFDTPRVDDLINYSQIDTIDKCLDALMDLKYLHDNFGDEEYLDKSELVKKRLAQLVS